MKQFQSWLPRNLEHTFIYHQLHYDKRSRQIHRQLFKLKSLESVNPARFLSFSLFTANLSTTADKISHIYLMGTLQNVILNQLVYKDWTTLIFVDASSIQVYPQLYETYLNIILQQFPKTMIIEVDWRTVLPETAEKKIVQALGAEIVQYKNKHGWDLALVGKELIKSENLPLQFAKTVYRFLPGGYHVVFLSRDADARINIREEIATIEWLHSTSTFQRMFDNVGHANPFLAGMWGGKSSCHNIIHNYLLYGTCNMGDVALPNIESNLLRFLSNKEDLLRGYGIDELFLGTIDQLAAHQYYDNVITYGKGTFFAGSVVFSFFTDRQSLKIGRRLLTLMPASKPDDVFGSHQSADNFKQTKQHEILFGKDCYFVGEDIPLKNTVDSNLIRWMIEASMHWQKATAQDLSPTGLQKIFKKFNITHLNPKTFSADLHNENLSSFQDHYGFDKRILPHFWYTFLTGTNENVSFFEAYNIFNPSDYEVLVFEAANREAYFAHSHLQSVIIQRINTTSFSDVSAKIVQVLSSKTRKKVMIHNKDFGPFFYFIRQYIEQHSKVFKHLNAEDKVSYFETMINTYPFSALRQFGLSV